MVDDNVDLTMGWGCTIHVGGWIERGMYQVIDVELRRLDIAFRVGSGALHLA